MGSRRRRRRRPLRSALGTYLIFLFVMCALFYLVTGIAPALDKARAIVTDIGREASLLFQ